MAASFRSLFKAGSDLWSRQPQQRRWRFALGSVALVLLLGLIFSGKPWEVQPSSKIKLSDVVTIWVWWAALIDLVVVSGLIALCPWWAGPCPERQAANKQMKTPRWFWPLVGVAMILAGCLALPRMNNSFWDDEELTVRVSIVGKFLRDKTTGQPEFDPLRWEETFFDYRTPNNHILHSLLARLSSNLWTTVARPDGLPFREQAIRLPALLFGLGAVAAVAWLLLDCGFPLAGVVAAFLFALHPWVIRYTSEARGYSMILCLVPLLLVFWRRALGTGEWKWWSACGAVQFALIYTYPGMAPFLVILNLLTPVALYFSRETATPFVSQTGRWFCINSLAALPAILLMAPLLPQAGEYFANESARGGAPGLSWVKNASSCLLAGVPWTGDSGLYPSMGFRWETHPLTSNLLMALAVGFVVAGLVRFLRGGWLMAVPACTFIAPPLLTFGLARIRNLLIYESYIINLLPGVVAFAALGIVLLSSRLFARLPGGRLMVPAACVAISLLYISATAGFRSWLVSQPLQQIRESVLLTRTTLDPDDATQKNVLTASFCIPPYLYDAHMIRLNSANELIALLRRADQEGKPLFLNIGMPWAARDYSPKMWAMFNNPELFAAHIRLHGFDPGLDRIVAAYLPGSAASFDFTDFEGDDR
jgi:hypothetical protein